MICCDINIDIKNAIDTVEAVKDKLSDNLELDYDREFL